MGDWLALAILNRRFLGQGTALVSFHPLALFVNYMEENKMGKTKEKMGERQVEMTAANVGRTRRNKQLLLSRAAPWYGWSPSAS